MNKYFLNIMMGFILIGFTVFSQDESYFEDLLREEVERIDPVKKPVIGGGIGMLGYIGEIKNNYGNLLFNQPAYKVNVSTFISKKNGIKANFTFLTGTISANERSYSNPARNINFESKINNFGINLEYGFGDLTKGSRKINPFVSIGIEVFEFNSKTDSFFMATQNDVFAGAASYEGQYIPYHYWTDGTIRNLPEEERNIFNSRIVNRDYEYETNMRENVDFGYTTSYSKNTLSIPLDLGLDFIISDRFTVRLGTSIHYTFTDFLDHVAPGNNKNLPANKLKDMFTYTYLTLHLDLFSESKTYIIENLFADIEDFDYIMFEDSDGDGKLDIIDECPETPMNLPTDSVGCPFDTDKDGVPDYLDKELDTPWGAIVDHEGVKMSEDELISLLDNSSAVPRKDVDLYIQKIDDITFSRYYGISNLDIPQKFKMVDKDGDGYISFDEVLDTIDEFFEFKSNFSTEDIYELNEFFFAQ